MQVMDVSNTLAALAAETGWLRRLARSLVQDAAAAEDLVHDAYVVAAEQRPDDGRPLRPWLVRMMRNLSRMDHRGARRRTARERAVAALAHEPATPAQLVGRIEMHRLLAKLVLTLDPAARDVVLLHYGEGLTSQQVGQRLGIAAGTVRWRLKRALDELRDKLEAHQPQRGWLPALSAFAGIPAPGGGVALKLLVAAAITLALVAGWIALQIHRLDRAELASSVASSSARRGTQRAPDLPARDRPTHAGQPALEAPAMPGRRRLVGQVIDAQHRPVADAEVSVTCGFYPLGEVSNERITTRTTSSGGFSALVDSTCQASVAAHHGGRSAEAFWMHPDEGEPKVLTLLPDVTATIHVIDAITDEPIAGAHAALQLAFAPNPSGPGISDATGAARLALLAPSLAAPGGAPMDLAVVVRAAGYVREAVPVSATAADLRKGRSSAPSGSARASRSRGAWWAPTTGPCPRRSCTSRAHGGTTACGVRWRTNPSAPMRPGTSRPMCLARASTP